jgi:N-acetylmuramoyl-L-alanine amidase
VGVAADAAVDRIRISASPEGTRVVFDLSGSVEHRVFTLSNPDRVVIDVPKARSGSALRLDAPTGAVAGFRSGRLESGELRLVLDLKQAAKPKSFLVGPDGPNGHRLVVDLVPPDRTVVQRAPSSGREIVVAIDAGHGGKDPGAIGRGGTQEKVVTLAIARRLAAEIDAQPGMRAMLVRNGDVYQDLRERREIAQRAGANLFLSIHADAVEDNPRVRGATVYALSERAANDEARKIVENRTNGSNVMGGVPLADYDPVIAGVLVDLSQEDAHSKSRALGQRLIRSLSAVTTIRKGQVQEKYLGVLKAADIPSLLVETAYISNPSDEAALRSSDFQVKLARAMREAIVEHFTADPPPGTWFASAEVQQAARKHVIARGETLSGIAERYRVSLASLLRSNRLGRNDVIRAGQVLTIPPG